MLAMGAGYCSAHRARTPSKWKRAVMRGIIAQRRGARRRAQPAAAAGGAACIAVHALDT